MSDRQRHPMIELQRAYRNRGVTYAREYHGELNGHPVFGKEIRDDQSQPHRETLRSEHYKNRRAQKREATRTTAQRSSQARHVGIELLLTRMAIDGHDPFMHPDNPMIDISLRRKLRRQGKGKVLSSKALKSDIVLPNVPATPPPPKQGRLDGLKRRASGLFVPVKDRTPS